MNTRKTRFAVATLALAVAGAVGALPARAGEAADARQPGSKEANIGALTGLAVGAAAAGPLGAMAGAVAGIVLGDRYHRQAQAAAVSEAQRTQLAGSLAEREATLSRTNELELEVSFRTDDDAVAVPAMAPLLKLGALIASMPQAQVRIAGYADPRGSDAWNDDLSLRRAQNVAAVLTQAGVPHERMLIEAHGKREAAAAGDTDAYALERRVTVRLELAGSGQVARRD